MCLVPCAEAMAILTANPGVLTQTLAALADPAVLGAMADNPALLAMLSSPEFIDCAGAMAAAMKDLSPDQMRVAAGNLSQMLTPALMVGRYKLTLA